jgi:hypothetical protein
MKFFVIPPNSELPLMHDGTAGYYCLAHLYLKDPAYKEFFLTLRNEVQGAFILLDNGAAEHSLVTEEILLDIVEELRPNEVIAPDVLFDADTTLSNLESFIEGMVDRDLLGFTSIFFCPQGRSKVEWMWCYEEGLKNPLVHTIGLSKIAVPKAFNDATDDTMIMESRHECVGELKRLGLIQKPIHMLGLGDPRELLVYQSIPLIRSNDSCNSVWSAMCENSWSMSQFDRVKTPHDYFERELSSQERERALSNIEWLKVRLSLA